MIPRLSDNQGKPSPDLILNWGCGKTRPEECINIDSHPGVDPDFLESITAPWDWESDTIDEVWLHHIIEHVSKDLHNHIFLEACRVLKQGGKIFIAYPDFIKCAQNFIENKDNRRDFWENTIYGLQRYAGDFHVCAVTERYIKSKLLDCGFDNLQFRPQAESMDYYSTVLGVKVFKAVSYEESQSWH